MKTWRWMKGNHFLPLRLLKRWCSSSESIETGSKLICRSYFDNYIQFASNVVCRFGWFNYILEGMVFIWSVSMLMWSILSRANYNYIGVINIFRAIYVSFKSSAGEIKMANIMMTKHHSTKSQSSLNATAYSVCSEHQVHTRV